MERRFGMLCQSRSAHVITKLAFHHCRAQQLRCSNSPGPREVSDSVSNGPEPREVSDAVPNSDEPRCFQQLCSLVVMAKAVTHKFVISMVEDFLRLDWPLIDHSGIVWIMDQRKFIGFAIFWTRII